MGNSFIKSIKSLNGGNPLNTNRGSDRPTDSDDDQIHQRYEAFNAWLRKIIMEYGLNVNDWSAIVQMFNNGASYDEMEVYASQQQSLHAQEYAEACQNIADQMGGGVGEYRGHLGKNNPLRYSEENQYESEGKGPEMEI